MNGSVHKSLTQLQNDIVQIDDLLSLFLFQMNSALLEVEQKQFGYVIVDCIRFECVFGVDHILQRFVQCFVCVQPEKRSESIQIRGLGS